MINFVLQAGIVGFGFPAMFLVSRKNKWGFILGLCSQPFWVISLIRSQQWGGVLLSCVYTCNWAYGAYNWFKLDNK